MKEPSLFEAGCPRIEVAICRKSSSVMSGVCSLATSGHSLPLILAKPIRCQRTKERRQKLLFQQAQKRKRRNWLNSYR